MEAENKTEQDEGVQPQCTRCGRTICSCEEQKD